MKPRFTTGEMARLHGISKQTLIFYDKAGVFRPSYQDARNGYRYYTADQLEMLDHILILKDMGLSLNEIREFLSLPDTSSALRVMKRQQEALKAQERRLRAALARLNRKVETLEELASDKAGQVRFERLDTSFLIVQAVPAPGGPVETDIALKTLLRRAQESQAPYFYQMGTRISRESLANGRYTQAFEVFFPLLRSLHQEGCTEKPGGLYARCAHRGPYEETGRTYQRLLASIGEAGYEISGGSYEFCVLDSLTVRNTQDYLTDIQIPLLAP